MPGASAVRTALDLMHVPTRVRLIRKSPLPPDVGVLISIAAGESEALSGAANATGRSPGEIANAAAFFIEQILLAPESDSYRMLGAASHAPAGELRHNMALLMQWLHPDKNLSADRTVFASRVALAWENLKTPERRSAYDGTIATGVHGSEQMRGKSGRRHRRRASGPGSPGRIDLPRSGFFLEALRAIFRVGRP